MLIQIANLLLQVFVSLVGGACLLRCYSQWLGLNLRSGPGQALGHYVLPLTNWIILPLRKLLPAVGRLDMASGTTAYLIVLFKTVAIVLLVGIPLEIPASVLLALFDFLDLIISSLIGLVFVSVILSWVSQGSQMQYLLALLTEPLLRPIQRVLPSMGALDLSPLVLLLGLQILQMVLNNLR
jgi:YggT family protein